MPVIETLASKHAPSSARGSAPECNSVDKTNRGEPHRVGPQPHAHFPVPRPPSSPLDSPVPLSGLKKTSSMTLMKVNTQYSLAQLRCYPCSPGLGRCLPSSFLLGIWLWSPALPPRLRCPLRLSAFFKQSTTGQCWFPRLKTRLRKSCLNLFEQPAREQSVPSWSNNSEMRQ